MNVRIPAALWPSNKGQPFFVIVKNSIRIKIKILLKYNTILTDFQMVLKRTENGSEKCQKLVLFRQTCRRSKTVKTFINSNSQYTYHKYRYYYLKKWIDPHDTLAIPEIE